MKQEKVIFFDQSGDGVELPAVPRNQGGLSRQKLQRAVEYIISNLERSPSLAQIAGEVQISPYHFTRLFKHSTGLPPHRYLIKCRIESARKLLEEGELAIAEIADKLGFQDQSHFTAQFRRETGITPKAYRQSL